MLTLLKKGPLHNCDIIEARIPGRTGLRVALDLGDAPYTLKTDKYPYGVYIPNIFTNVDKIRTNYDKAVEYYGDTVLIHGDRKRK